MRPRLLTLVGLVLCIVLGAVAPATAEAAFSRSAAASIALRVLAPARQAGAVIVYETARPLGPRQVVFPAVLDSAPESGAQLTVPPIGQPAWLFYEDLEPGARFSHPTRTLLISRRSGRVLRDLSSDWWPLVNGADPPFVADPLARRFQIFNDTSQGSLVGTPPRLAARATQAPGPIVLPPNSLAGECIIQIGLMSDKEFAQDFVGVNAVADSLAPYGLQNFTVAPTLDAMNRVIAQPNGAALQQSVTDAIANHGCKDILIYIDGHGTAPGNSVNARVLVGMRWIKTGTDPDGTEHWTTMPQYVTSLDLQAILNAHPSTGFKFKIDACYWGGSSPTCQRRTTRTCFCWRRRRAPRRCPGPTSARTCG